MVVSVSKLIAKYKKRLPLGLAIAACVIAGSWLVMASRAATPFVSQEPETGTKSGTVTAIADTSASGSGAIKFGATSPATGPLYGTLDTAAANGPTEAANGMKIAMVELKWRLYEPEDGAFDKAYADGIKARVNALKQAGMQVTLAMGIHFTPGWVRTSIPNSTYIDHLGNTTTDIDMVYNQLVRDQVAAYMAKINTDIGLNNFSAIRLTSGGDPEILYPSNNYWAFGPNAQNGPNMSTSLPKNPFPGWKPGSKTITTAQVRQWADWYIGALDNVVDWQMTTLNRLGYTGRYQLLTPGNGTRPSKYDSDIANYLPAGTTGVGAVWQRFYQLVPNKSRATVYVSSVADNSGSNDTCTAADNSLVVTSTTMNSWSTTRFQARLAYEYGMPISGENPGYSDTASWAAFYKDTGANGMISKATTQAKTCKFKEFYWAHDYRLFDGTVPFSAYAGYAKN